MKFFRIANPVCTQCDVCMEVCPTAAIYPVDDNRYINYDKCLSCGACMKSCKFAAIGVETVEQLVIEAENSENQRREIRRLQKESDQLIADMELERAQLLTCIRNMPGAAFIAGHDGKLYATNLNFDRLTESAPENGMPRSDWNIYNILPDEIIRFVRTAASDGNITENVSMLGETRVSVTVTPIPGERLLGVMRPLNDHSLSSDKILSLLHSTIERKMSMIQQVGTLLGEEASLQLNELNTIVKIIRGEGGA